MTQCIQPAPFSKWRTRWQDKRTRQLRTLANMRAAKERKRLARGPREEEPRHIYDAQTFMRHASVTTTESHYGHHLKRHLDEVKLTLPTPSTFQPTIVHG